MTWMIRRRGKFLAPTQNQTQIVQPKAYSPNRQCYSSSTLTYNGDSDNEPSGLKLLTVPFSLGSSEPSNNEVPVCSTNETKVQ